MPLNGDKARAHEEVKNMSHPLPKNVPSHLEIEHITCPNKYCNHYNTPTCERDCEAYQEFKERLIDLMAEVFP